MWSARTGRRTVLSPCVRRKDIATPAVAAAGGCAQLVYAIYRLNCWVSVACASAARVGFAGFSGPDFSEHPSAPFLG